MTATISACFQDPSAAHLALEQLRAAGYRVCLGRQRPSRRSSGAICPGNGLPASCHMENSVLLPDPCSAVLTVLATNASAKRAADILLRCGGKTFH